MKSILAVLNLKLIIVLVVCAFPAFAQDHYVVIGAFANEANALRFTSNARRMSLDATYQFNPDRNLFYVHVMKTQRKEDARNWSIYFQHQTSFKGTWVFSENREAKAFLIPNEISLPSIQSFRSKEKYVVSAEKDLTYLAPIKRRSSNVDSDLPVENKVAENTDLENKVTEDKVVDNNVVEVKVVGTKVVENNEAETEAAVNSLFENNVAETKVAEKISLPWTETWASIEDIDYIRDLPASTDVRERISQSSGKILTCIIETADGKSISGEAMIVNQENKLSLLTFKQGEVFALKADSKNKMLTVVCDIFGYKEDVKTFNLDNPLRAKGIKRNEQGILEVRFQLERLKKQDISIMYNVSFLNDAAIMKPSSMPEVDELVIMMKSNPNYEIVIHSHCNGNGRRTIKIPTGKNYFDTLSTSSSIGSASKLTRLRAEMIRSYLADQGIERKRIDIMPWAGKEMLVEETSPDAVINNRIEIEVMEDK